MYINDKHDVYKKKDLLMVTGAARGAAELPN